MSKVKVTSKANNSDDTIQDTIDKSIIASDMMTLLYAEITKRGLAGHHIDSMNRFYSEGIRQIVTQLFPCERPFMKNTRDKTDEDRLISSIAFKVEFTNVNITRPTTTKYKSGAEQLQTPSNCRIHNLTYKAPLYLDANITAVATYKDGTTKTRTDGFKNFRMASIPCMIGSRPCVTANASRETLRALHEDPNDIGGYFIIRGMEWAVNNLESTTYNAFNVFKNMHGSEIARGNFLSKPGDQFENSYQIILRLMVNGAITVELPPKGGRDVIILPFYLVFRAFGIVRDREIVTHITYSQGTSTGDAEDTSDDPVTRDMLAVLNRAFNASADIYEPIKKNVVPEEIVNFIAKNNVSISNPTLAATNIDVQKYLNESTYSMLDKFILPHIGAGPDARIPKLRFLGHLINKLIAVSMGMIDSTDRDSYANKRIFAAGTSLSKAFKTHFNFGVSTEIINHLTKDFTSTSFSDVRLAESVKSAIKADDLEKSLIQVITSGNKVITVKRNEVTNRVPSEMRQLKNDMNAKSIANQVNAPNSNASKQNERADKMRRVHATGAGFIDPSASADSGEKVGMNRQLACSVSISPATSSWNLKKTLSDDPDIIPLAKCPPTDILRKKLTKVFVNGDWVGCTQSAHGLAYKYRQERRADRIRYRTSIIWQVLIREVHFWTDVGRMHRPLVIVYNNLQEYIDARRKGKPIAFKQWINLKKQHIIDIQAKRITIDYLRKQQIIEYISPGEQENCYLAMNIDVLRAASNDVINRYTHCDIDQAIFGLVTLASPLAGHSNATRTTYYTNHRKQSTGWFALNYPYRIDKLTTLQHYCEKPIVSTFADALTNPYGHICNVALAIYDGYNQEDSIAVNETSVDCGMFNASYYNHQDTELDKNEVFGNPDRLRTVDNKKDRSYEFLDGFCVRKGTIVQKNYVLIEKVEKIHKPTDDYLYVDKSVVYTKTEPAYIERVVDKARNDEDIPIAKIKYRINRPLGVGEKLSSRSGNKGIVSHMKRRNDMLYFEDGSTADLVVNPHSIPTRMATNQIIECVLGMLCTRRGCFINATTFTKIDIDEAVAELAKHGIHNGGHKRAFNGMTGEWLDVLIFCGPTTYQRIAKFVADEQYAVHTGPTNAISRQPVDGRNNNGGIRLGEMEKDVFCAAGTMDFMAEKWYKDSDGFNVYICAKCGNNAVVNERLGMYKCKTCQGTAEIARVPSTWSANAFKHYVSGMNIKMSYELAPHTYHVNQ